MLCHCIDIIECNLTNINMAVLSANVQIAKYKSPPIFPDLRYLLIMKVPHHAYYTNLHSHIINNVYSVVKTWARGQYDIQNTES